MIEQGLWHPVAAIAELGVERPLAVTLLGDDLVLWRGVGGAAHAFTDRCPHRGARLSLGRLRVVDGETRLACGYHGWQFGGEGGCRHIPAAPEAKPGAAQSARAWRTRQAHGLVWVAADEAPAAAPPDPGALPARAVVCGPFDVDTSAPRAVENFLDTAHFGFIHEGWLGDAVHTEVPPYEVVLDAEGRPGVPHYLAWQPRASSTSTEGGWIAYRYQVLSPYAALLVKQAAGVVGGAGEAAAAPTEAYALWACPVAEERCRVWFTMYTSDAAVSDAELIDFETRIFTQDQPVLESQRPKRLPLSGGEAHGPADRLSVAYRRYLRDAGIRYGVC